MITINDAMNADDLARSLELLAAEINRMRAAGPLPFQEVQKAVSSLTRAQLVLNDLERIEIRERGVSMNSAEQFAALESRIRSIRDELYHDLTNRRPNAADGTGAATMAEGEDGDHAHHIAR